MAQVRPQDRYLQAEDLQWEQQLLLDRSTILPNIAAMAVQKLSPRQLRWEKDWGHTRHLNIMNKEQAFAVPQLMQAMLSHDYSLDENMNYWSHRLEAIMNLETLTTNPVFYDHLSTLCRASRTEETTTTLGSYCNKVPTLSGDHTVQWSLLAKPANTWTYAPWHCTRNC